MNEPSCQDARRWMAMAREAGDDAPVGMRFHLERCEACSRLAARYREAVSGLARETASPTARLPAAAVVVAAARDEGRRARPWLFAGAVAVVTATVTVLALTWTTEDPAHAPSPEGAIASDPPRPAPEPSPTPSAPVVASPSLEGVDLTTGAEAAELADPAVATLAVAPGSDLSVPSWSGADAEVALRRGGVTVSLRPRVGDQRFAVRTEELVATAVGTEFSVVRGPLEGTRVAVREGVVYVEVLGGGAVTLVAGDVFVVAPAGRVPTAPEQAAEPAAVSDAAPPARRPAVAPLALRIQAARRLLAQGRAEEAIAALRALSPAEDADRASASALLGDALSLTGRLPEARDAYAEAARAGRGAMAAGALADLARVEARLGHDEAARDAWRRVLAATPDGALAPRALAELGDDAALLERFPESGEATGALLRLGRGHLDAARWEAAVALFSRHLDARDPARREAALVGLMRARLGQGREDAVRTLLARYDRDFPDGARRAEVGRLRAAVPPP